MSEYKSSSQLNNYTFENFITGPENITAFTTAKIFSDTSVIINPLLVIYGLPGIGKTYLVNSILNQMILNHKKLNYIHVSGDGFFDEFITFLGEGKLDKFKKRYLKADLLIIEGMEFFQNKEETPYVLLHIISHLIENGKKVVLTSGQSRFTLNLNSGFIRLFKLAQIVKIIRPGVDERKAFIKRQCVLNQIELNDEIMDYIAKSIKSSFRAIDNYLAILFYLQDVIDEPLTLKHIKKEIRPYRG